MSVESDLRVHALERDGGCVWPHSCGGRLEMAHIIPKGSGGTNTLGNVAMLCKQAHDAYDGRSSWTQSFDIITALYWEWLQVGELTGGECRWPECDARAARLCFFHDMVLSPSVPVHGRLAAIRVLFAAYVDAR